MRRKAVAALLAILLMVAGFTGLASADTYYVYNQWGGTWSDANKTWVGDSNLCWAGAASNILAWTGWSTSTYSTATSIFQYFKANWTNYGSLPFVGWEWWFDGTNLAKGLSSWAQLKTSGSGNFWSGVIFANYFYETYYSPSTHQNTNLLATMAEYLQSGYGVTLGIYKSNGSGSWYGHALTAWGFDYTQGTYTSIYVTDSDDGVTALQNYKVVWDATNLWWVLTDYYGGSWHIADVEGLNQHTPIPASLLLLGSGLLGLAGWRIRFRRV